MIGDVELGEDSSVWFNTVLRGDVNPIRIGQRTNIQDLTMVHVTSEHAPPAWATTSPSATTWCSTAAPWATACWSGMGAILMDGVEVGDDCIIGAGALLTPGTQVPAGLAGRGQPRRR